MTQLTHQPDPNLDLVFERITDISRELIWKAWTTPEHLMPWFTPAPWTTIDCEIDFRPGGIFRKTMRSPEGQEFPSVGCYLEIVPNQKLVWTNALLPDFRPAKQEASESHTFFSFTAIVSLESHENGTKYSATLMHPDEASCKRHNEMGFQDGWSQAFDQLVEYVKSI